MPTPRQPRLAVGSLAVALFASSLAAAELPQHLHLETLRPTAEELGNPSPDEMPPFVPNWFGYDVAVREGYAFIGMPLTLTTGRVAVFTQRAEGWVRTSTITASDMTSEDRFGGVVSYRDGLLVVGSRRAAYVYKQVGGVWREQQKILPPQADAVRTFATDIKHQDGVLAIGGYGSRGYVYVYERDSKGKFLPRARLSASNDSTQAFGISIDMTKRIIVVGAIDAAYIFGRDRQGRWLQRQELVPSDAPLSGAHGIAANFGVEVAVDRDMILVGAPGALVPGAEHNEFIHGAVYGFVPGDGRYVESFKLYPPLDGVETSGFGRSIAMFGERFAIAGDEPDWYAEATEAGIVFTYTRAGPGAVPLSSMTVSQGQRASVAIANNRLMVGTPYAGWCLFESECPGEAEVYDLSRFGP